VDATAQRDTADGEAAAGDDTAAGGAHRRAQATTGSRDHRDQ